jgi:hypothetical protein
MAGATGLEAVTLCIFAEENEQKFGHVHTGTHKV